ncbi:MAG TPA: hypothetical protein VKV39_00380 [Candidatus Sulfotelmatobacter sp.]|nr:hypothetical protein [Candidatus Sulfotelmatobacter sp.]
MTRPSQGHYPPRAPRVTLPETVFAVVQLENNRQIPAKLQRISLTGGLLDLAVYLEERIRVDLKIPIGAGVVQARAAMLFPMRSATGYLQPFRFTNLRPEQQHILDREINELLRRNQVSAAATRGLGVHLPNFLLESL